MNWDAIGSASELVGALSTIVALIYLGVQIRHNTRSTRASSYQAAMTSIAEWTRTIGSNPELAMLFFRGARNSESLSEPERVQFGYLLLSLARNFENLFFQYRNGTLDEAHWRPWASRIERTFATAGTHNWWVEQAPAFSDAFRTFVEEIGSTHCSR
ncbi:MAG: hypothetical protein HKP27_02070 [Myxococcales bacterium]|nr:hypothetical protein [Myxococcales bacterium]